MNIFWICFSVYVLGWLTFSWQNFKNEIRGRTSDEKAYWGLEDTFLTLWDSFFAGIFWPIVILVMIIHNQVKKIENE